MRTLLPTLLIIGSFFSQNLHAEELRVAFWNGEFSRKGPGLLIDELLKDEEGFAENFSSVSALDADILLLLSVDQDDENWAAALLAQKLGYEYYSTLPVNRGLPTGLDLNQDDWMDEEDFQGYAQFRGQKSMLVLAQKEARKARSFSKLLLKDYSSMPQLDGQDFYSAEAWVILRLGSVGLWDHDFGGFHLLSAYTTAPAFDGEERRNIMRNAAEIRWWKRYISGKVFLSDQGEESKIEGAFILMGSLNIDPLKGDGERAAILEFLESPLLNPVEFEPRETVDWSRIGLGKMRVDYILPSCHFEILDHGKLDMNTDHQLLWADLRLKDHCNLE